MQQYADIYLLQNHSLLLRFYLNFCTLQYDLYQRLQLQFYVLLMMRAVDTRNM